MALVSYSESDSGSGSDSQQHVAKKRRTSAKTAHDSPPPLPAAFLNLYTSTVRASTHDDPSLHGGRKRGVPHVEGNWAAHVYLEWHASSFDSALLSRLVVAAAAQGRAQTARRSSHIIHSLLQDSLSVPLPLHISLSAPLVLRTETKDAFHSALRASLLSARPPRPAGPSTHDAHTSLSASASAATGSSALTVSPTSLAWHANEDRTRKFLVLKVSPAMKDPLCLERLLGASNSIAHSFGLPQLYVQSAGKSTAVNGGLGGAARGVHMKSREGGTVSQGKVEQDAADCFHISLGWSLHDETDDDELAASKALASGPDVEVLMRQVRDMNISFDEVKIRLGRDVTAVPLDSRARDDGAKRGILG